PQVWANGINQANKMALLTWEKETGIELVQVNGQRRYGGPPPGWVGGPPPAGTEVYIGKLPQDMYEDVLIPLFQSVGKLYEFRLMMTFSGLNRGFAYARYSTQRSARNAVATFNHFEVRPGWTIVVCRSIQKRELIMHSLATSVSQWELEAMLKQVTEGILSVTLHTSPCHGQAKFAVLKYSSHQAATLAKKALMQGKVRLGGSRVRVDWLDHDLKKKLQLQEERPPPRQVQECNSLAVSPVLQDVLDRLNALGYRQHLEMALIFTKCVQVKPNGWLRFWYQVVIPGSPVPFSGFTWVQQDGQGQSGHDEAEVTVA
ncbi:DND1 protein, partial [Campylorhamphus procurvoides]|nr:DND1 protein [Campylorhamphus procurvoides]